MEFNSLNGIAILLPFMNYDRIILRPYEKLTAWLGFCIHWENNKFPPPYFAAGILIPCSFWLDFYHNLAKPVNFPMEEFTPPPQIFFFPFPDTGQVPLFSHLRMPEERLLETLKEKEERKRKNIF